MHARREMADGLCVGNQSSACGPRICNGSLANHQDFGDGMDESMCYFLVAEPMALCCPKSNVLDGDLWGFLRPWSTFSLPVPSIHYYSAILSVLAFRGEIEGEN